MAGRTQERERAATSVGKRVAIAVLLAIIFGLPLLAVSSMELDWWTFTAGMFRLSFFFLAPAMLAGWMGRKRIVGPGAGFLIGLFLSWLGPIVLLFFPTGAAARSWANRCPHCDERIRSAAKICKHCRQSVALEPEFDD